MTLATAALWLPTVNAALNTLATLLLAAGWLFIRRGRWRAHRAAMIAAFAVSTVFLVCYLTYHALVGHVPFTGRGTVRTVYFTILITHILLAVTVPVLAITMFLMFQAVFSWAEVPMDAIKDATGAVGEFLKRAMPDGMLQSLLVDGIVAGEIGRAHV